jgi:hypothetical protein
MEVSTLANTFDWQHGSLLTTLRFLLLKSDRITKVMHVASDYILNVLRSHLHQERYLQFCLKET